MKTIFSLPSPEKRRERERGREIECDGDELSERRPQRVRVRQPDGRGRLSSALESSPSIIFGYPQWLVSLSLSLSLDRNEFRFDIDVELCSRRYSIKGRVYPAILPVENNKVTGKARSLSDL